MTAALPRPCATALSIALLLSLAACAGTGDYPSLARRPAERMDTGVPAPVAAAPAPSPASSSVTTRLAELQETARAAHARFAARRPAAERSAAAAGPLGSESWAAASVALAGLEEAYEQQGQALAVVDQMQVDQQVADAGAQSGDTAAITAARDQVAAGAETDGDVVTRLRARLGGK